MKVELKEAGEALLQRRTSASHQQSVILPGMYKKNHCNFLTMHPHLHTKDNRGMYYDYPSLASVRGLLHLCPTSCMIRAFLLRTDSSVRLRRGHGRAGRMPCPGFPTQDDRRV